LEDERLTDLYIILISLLVKYESSKAAANKKEPETPAEIKELSSPWKWLADQYGRRYGVWSAYRKIVYLDILAQSFDHTKSHLQLLQAALLEVIDELRKPDVVLTKSEVIEN
jgi:hypothetical protein